MRFMYFGSKGTAFLAHSQIEWDFCSIAFAKFLLLHSTNPQVGVLVDRRVGVQALLGEVDVAILSITINYSVWGSELSGTPAISNALIATSFGVGRLSLI